MASKARLGKPWNVQEAGRGMFKWIKMLTTGENLPSAPTMPQAAVAFFEAAVKIGDQKFGETWPFDPAWIGLLGVASDLDQANGNTAKMDEISEAALDAFTTGMTPAQCGALLALKHLSNQRQLEDMMRRSQARRR